MAVIAASVMLLSRYLMEYFDSDEENDEEDDEENTMMMALQNNTKTNPIRINNYMEYVIPNYSARQFQQSFRITREAYERF